MSVVTDSILVPSPAETTRLNVLVADGDAEMRLYLRRCLERLNRPLGQVLEADDGHAALTLAHEIDLDLVICDVRLPGLDGYALRHRLAAEALPVLLISGAFLADESPDPTVLAQPFNAQTLCTRLLDLLDPGGAA